MTDEQLVHAVADYPYIGDYGTNNVSIEAGIRELRKECDDLDELLNRPNGLQSLQKYGTELVQTYSISGETPFRRSATPILRLNLDTEPPW